MLKRTDGTNPYTVNEAAKSITYDQVTFSNNIGSTLVKNILVKIGETTVSNYDNFFLRNALDNLLHTPHTIQETIVRDSQYLWGTGETAVSYNTKEWKGRHDVTKDGGIFEIIIPFNSDLASTNKFFPPGVEMQIMITLNSPEFYLVGASKEENNKHNIVVEDVYFQATRATVFPSISQAHELLFKEMNAVYALRHVKTTERIVSKGTINLDYDLFLPGETPYSLTMVLMPSASVTGDTTTEPLFFERHGLE